MNKSWTFKKGGREKGRMWESRNREKVCDPEGVGEAPSGNPRRQTVGRSWDGGTEHSNSSMQLLRPPGFCPAKEHMGESWESEEEEASAQRTLETRQAVPNTVTRTEQGRCVGC